MRGSRRCLKKWQIAAVENLMKSIRRIAKVSVLVALGFIVTGCCIGPPFGYVHGRGYERGYERGSERGERYEAPPPPRHQPGYR
jgi:hypothetical protein